MTPRGVPRGAIGGVTRAWGMTRLRPLLGNLASVPITLFGLVLITFLIGRVVPIDPVLAVVGDRAPQELVERTRREMGLDRSLPEQFVRYVGALADGDLGRSVMTGNPVTQDIARLDRKSVV